MVSARRSEEGAVSDASPRCGAARAPGLALEAERGPRADAPGLAAGLRGCLGRAGPPIARSTPVRDGGRAGVRISREDRALGGPQRLAYLPAQDEPVTFGVHSEVADHYGVSPEQYPPHATTLDYVVAAAGG